MTNKENKNCKKNNFFFILIFELNMIYSKPSFSAFRFFLFLSMKQDLILEIQ